MERRILAATTGAVTLTALVGGLASRDTSSAWYRSLVKPPIQPPPAAFPVVWTALYGSIATASAAVLSSAPQEEGRAFGRALALNLTINASWTWVFFTAHRLGPATGVAGLLALSSADLARRGGRVDRRAGAALAPYAAWCGFATLLSAAIWRRNRGR